MKFLFVGEKPSRKAVSMGVTWRDGRLAAKQLFDALRACGIDPDLQSFDNVFHSDHGADRISSAAIRRIRASKLRVVAMGRKAYNALQSLRIDCVLITHPAARGKIRAKAAYAAHVKSVLGDHQ